MTDIDPSLTRRSALIAALASHSSPEPAVPTYSRLRVHRKRSQVLGVDLKCSERAAAPGHHQGERLPNRAKSF
jgi:hypothetical protein